MAFVCQPARHFQAIQVSNDRGGNRSHGMQRTERVENNNLHFGATNHTHQAANPWSFSISQASPVLLTPVGEGTTNLPERRRYII